MMKTENKGMWTAGLHVSAEKLRPALAHIADTVLQITTQHGAHAAQRVWNISRIVTSFSDGPIV